MNNIKNTPKSVSDKNAFSAAKLELGHPNEIADVAPWDIDFQQIEPGEMAIKMALLGSEDLMLTHHSMSKAAHQRGASPDGWLTFGIADQATTKSWQGSAISDLALLAFSSKDGFESHSLSGHSGITLSVSKKYLYALAEAHDLSFDFDNAHSHILQARKSRKTLASLKDTILSTVHTGPTRDISALTEDISFGLLRVIHDQDGGSEQSKIRYRDAVLKRAIERMYTKNGEAMSITDLCTDTGISWRTLNRAFQDEFGIGPKAFYSLFRLNRVRYDLLCSPEIDSIADVANKYDFWHMGQLAKDYRQLFGELPSNTRARSSPRSANYFALGTIS